MLPICFLVSWMLFASFSCLKPFLDPPYPPLCHVKSSVCVWILALRLLLGKCPPLEGRTGPHVLSLALGFCRPHLSWDTTTNHSWRSLGARTCLSPGLPFTFTTSEVPCLGQGDRLLSCKTCFFHPKSYAMTVLLVLCLQPQCPTGKCSSRARSIFIPFLYPQI